MCLKYIQEASDIILLAFFQFVHILLRMENSNENKNVEKKL